MNINLIHSIKIDGVDRNKIKRNEIANYDTNSKEGFVQFVMKSSGTKVVVPVHNIAGYTIAKEAHNNTGNQTGLF